MAAATQAALGFCRDRPSSAPACMRARWWRTAPSVTPRSRAMWLLVAPRAAKVLMVMRASGSSRPILASTPRNGVVRGSQPETIARKSSRRLTRRCPVALHLDPFRIAPRVQHAVHYQPACRCGRGNQIYDGRMADERTASPSLGDVAEQAMLDLVPLRGAGRIVADRDR